MEMRYELGPWCQWPIEWLTQSNTLAHIQVALERLAVCYQATKT